MARSLASAIEQIALDDVEPQIGEVGARTGRTDQRAHLMPGPHQMPRYGRADETACAGDQDHGADLALGRSA